MRRRQSNRIARLALIGGLTLLAGCPAPAGPPPVEPTPKPVPAPTAKGPDRSKGMPTPGPSPRWTAPPVATWTMKNGITVWHVPQRGTPLVSLRLVLPNGSATDPKGKAGLTSLTADMLDEGAGDRDAFALSESLQRLATNLGYSVGTDAVSFSMNMLADKVAPSLAILADVLMRPSLKADEFDRRKRQHVAQSMSQEANPVYARSVVTRRAIFGEGYGSWVSAGTKTTLDKLALADVKRHYAAIIKPDGATVVVVGDIERAAIEKALGDALGKWKGTPRARKAKLGPNPLAPAMYLIDFPGATQSAITVGRRSDGAEADDLYAARIFNRALGGSFGSRLNLNLREDKGYTYGARSFFFRMRQGGIYGLASQVKADTTKPSIDEMYKELDAMGGNKPLTAEEHRQAIDGLLLGFPGRFERLSGLAFQLGESATLGRPADYLRLWPDRIKAVTLEAARASAKTWTTKDAFVIVVSGDVTKLDLSGYEMPRFLCDPEGLKCEKQAK